MTAPNISSTPTGVPTNTDAAATTVPSGADMPATVTTGIRPSTEYIGRGDWQNRLRDAERNLDALNAHVKAHPEATEGAKASRELYEGIRDAANNALAAPAAAATPPARSGAPEALTTDQHVAGEGEE